MDNVEIRKAEIFEGLFLSTEYDELLPKSERNSIKIERTVPIHDDLKGAFFRLNKHLALLCEQLSAPDAGGFDQWYVKALDKYHVTGIVIKGHDETEGVILIGNRELSTGKSINLIAPLEKWEKSKYLFAEELRLAVDGVLEEVHQYLFEGKRAPERQLDLFDGNIKIETSIKGKKGKKKKEEADATPEESFQAV